MEKEDYIMIPIKISYFFGVKPSYLFEKSSEESSEFKHQKILFL